MDRRQETSLKNAFGLDSEESSHHFLVRIPRDAGSKVEISEHQSWDPETGSSDVTYGTRLDGQIRVRLARPKWDAIADEVRAQFNLRLRQMGRRSGNWRAGSNLVRRELGKELVLLAWAIEDADLEPEFLVIVDRPGYSVDVGLLDLTGIKFIRLWPDLEFDLGATLLGLFLYNQANDPGIMFREAGGLTTDDVLDMHNFLKDFRGNFSRLFDHR